MMILVKCANADGTDSTCTIQEYIKKYKVPLTIYYGESVCQATIKSNDKNCTNLAYYKEKNVYLCGMHSNKKTRTVLLKNPNKKTNRLASLSDHKETINEAIKLNKGKVGDIVCFQMKMMKKVPLVSGYLNVFPNYKHNNRTDGYGCSQLSPMSLGPVVHNEPNLPPAKNIENMHQTSKVWPNEVDKKDNPTKEWYKQRLEGYNDPIPHRHKFDAKTMTTLRKQVNGQNRNAPLYSLHLTDKGKEVRFTYVESRVFYCKAYEKLAKQTENFKTLTKKIKSGTNIIICGYDAYPVTKDLYAHYIDATKPFGHELVLYTLLTVADADDYPWNIYYRKHTKLYKGITF